MRTNKRAAFAVVLLLSSGVLVLLFRTRVTDQTVSVQSLDPEFNLRLPGTARILHAARLDGTPYAVIQCTKREVDELLSSPLLRGKVPSTIVHYLHDEPRLPWWRPGQVTHFRFFDLRLPSGDGLHILIEQSDTDGGRVFLHAFET